jgi:putative intracellular protease/amidase
MDQKLAGKKVAVVATGGFEQVELTEPRRALMEAGATAHLIAPDLTCAGATWVDREVVTGKGPVTSRKPDDIRPSTRR